MVKHIHVPIPNQRSESATSHVIKEGAVRTALTTPRDLLKVHLNLDQQFADALRKTKAPIVPA